MRIILYLLSLVAVVLTATLPSEIPACKTSDSACLRSSAESALSYLSNGNKELGIPPLDPLRGITFSIERKPGPISLFQKYSDASLSGLSNTKVQQLIIDLKKCRLRLEATVPRVEVNAKYELKGQLLLFPVDANGDVIAILKDSKVEVDATCEKADSEHLRLTSTTVSITPKEAEFHLGNLISGNEQLEKEVHKVIDDDPLAFYEVLRPAAELALGEMAQKVVDQIFEKISQKDLFKD